MKIARHIIDAINLAIDGLDQQKTFDELDQQLLWLKEAIDEAEEDLGYQTFLLDHHQQNTSRPIE